MDVMLTINVDDMRGAGDWEMDEWGSEIDPILTIPEAAQYFEFYPNEELEEGHFYHGGYIYTKVYEWWNGKAKKTKRK